MFKIAIDGPAGSGKSTVAKIVAQKLNFEYIDTGAMYRAITYKAMQLGIDLEDENQYDFLKDTKLDIINGHYIMDGIDVSEEIRRLDVSNNVSTPSKMANVRSYLVAYQRLISNAKNCIMDGRDIGSVVLPDASLKIYLDATIECRASRRYLERLEKGTTLSLEDTIKEIELRDWKDSTRKVSPLRCPEDAFVIDSTKLSIDEVVSQIINLVNERLKEKKMSKHTYSKGQSVRGVIIGVTNDALYLTLEDDSKAVIYANDIKGYQAGDKLTKMHNEGEEFVAFVKQITQDKNDKTKVLYILSTKLGDEIAKLEEFKKLKDEDTIIKAKVVRVTGAGADLEYHQTKLFLPIKAIDLKAEALKSLKGQTLDVIVTHVNKERLQVVVSNVMAMKKQARLAKEEAMAKIEAGMTIEGEVSTILPYGAIINLGLVSGLLHQSEIDHKHVKNVADRLKVGDKITVKVLKVHDGKIALSMKALVKHPWEVLKDQYHVGDVFEGSVIKMIDAGAIIKLTDDYSGLLPNSEYSWFSNVKLVDEVHEGDQVTVKIKNIDDEKKRISLSHKETLENTWADIKLRRGDKIKVVIASINDKGALVNYKNVQGFLSVAEVTSAKRINRVDEVYEVGAEIEVIVKECDPSTAKLRVSAKALEEKKERDSFDQYFEQQDKETPKSTIGDIIGHFDFEEEEAQKALNKKNNKNNKNNKKDN